MVENRAGAGGALGSELVGEGARPTATRCVVSGIASHVIAPLLPQRHAVRPGEGLHPHRAFRRPAGGAGGESRRAGEGPEGVRRAGEGEAGHALLRLARQRHAGPARRRAFQAAAPASTCSTCPTRAPSGAVADLIAGQIQSSRPRSPPPRARSAPAARAPSRSAPRRGCPIIRTCRPSPRWATPTSSRRCGSRSPGRPSMPADIVERLNAEVQARARAPDVRERLQARGHRAEPARRARVHRLRGRRAEALGAGRQGSGAKND